ncbi:MAG: ATP-binding protein, partial [Bacilli bacterium]
QFSKPHATNIKEQSIQGCIQRVIHLMGPRAVLLGHQLYFDDCINTSYVMMDKDKIVQVLLNIVQNSLEAMDISGVVYISLYELNNYALIEIIDTGTGILESEVEEIFTPFYTTKENGIGLGLSICQKVIQDHGGVMEVISSSNLGTTFCISLPLANIPMNQEKTVLKLE